ncbi:pantoate--beta-alanine ligase [bacterium A37T11]|nr:pantoate--beta-alanine ligase [bacterium A37T11]
MKIFEKKLALTAYLDNLRQEGHSIALVPTMGALHMGHISLIKKAKELAHVVVCSIFVNPTQFNDPADLAKYPRTEEQDKAILTSAGCDVIFMPTVSEMYGPDEHWQFDLAGLEDVLEGALRPGHYQGVTQVVKKLLDATRPQYALFGQKDYQQWLVIQYMVQKLSMDVQIVRCPIIREPAGLAMSSRNVRLSDAGRWNALALYRVLKGIKEQGRSINPAKLRSNAWSQLEAAPGVTPEYLVICEGTTLNELEEWPENENTEVIALVAARVEDVRLIDNMIL